ncbi:DDE-type integrase/transposase/recombinase [Acinetobacter nectaris]
MDGTYTKIKGKCKYWYRPVDLQGKTIDFLLGS